MDELRAILEEDKSVRLVTVTHASNVTGTVTPVEEIGRLCKEKGVALCVDGAQAAPHRKVDVATTLEKATGTAWTPLAMSQKEIILTAIDAAYGYCPASLSMSPAGQAIW